VSDDILNALLLVKPFTAEGKNPRLASGRLRGDKIAHDVAISYKDENERNFRVKDARLEVIQILESIIASQYDGWREYAHNETVRIAARRKDRTNGRRQQHDQGDTNKLSGLYSNRLNLAGYQRLPFNSNLNINLWLKSLLNNLVLEYADIERRGDAFRVFNTLKNHLLTMNHERSNVSKLDVDSRIYKAMLESCMLSSPETRPKLIPAVTLLSELCLLPNGRGKVSGSDMRMVMEEAITMHR
jgi:hypothetical protein